MDLNNNAGTNAMATQSVKLTGAVLSEMDVASLLAIDIDLVEVVTDFAPMPTGMYRFNVKGTELKEFGDDKKMGIQTEFCLTECVELAHADNQDDVDVVTAGFADGATVKHIETFFLDGGKKKTAYGLRSFVTLFKALVPAGAKANPQELMELSVGSSGVCFIEKGSYIPEGKTEEERKYTSRIKCTAVMFD